MRIVLVLTLFIFSSASFAHGGEDHGAAAPAPVSAQSDPRAAASSELFELVAVAEAQRLLLYLDRQADNAPVSGASLELESGAWQAQARETAPGEYAVETTAFAQAGHYPLTVSLQSGEDTDLLALTLERGGSPAGGAALRWAWIGWGGGALLAALLGIAWRMRRQAGGRRS